MCQMICPLDDTTKPFRMYHCLSLQSPSVAADNWNYSESIKTDERKKHMNVLLIAKALSKHTCMKAHKVTNKNHKVRETLGNGNTCWKKYDSGG